MSDLTKSSVFTKRAENTAPHLPKPFDKLGSPKKATRIIGSEGWIEEELIPRVRYEIPYSTEQIRRLYSEEGSEYILPDNFYHYDAFLYRIIGKELPQGVGSEFWIEQTFIPELQSKGDYAAHDIKRWVHKLYGCEKYPFLYGADNDPGMHNFITREVLRHLDNEYSFSWVGYHYWIHEVLRPHTERNLKQKIDVLDMSRFFYKHGHSFATHSGVFDYPRFAEAYQKFLKKRERESSGLSTEELHMKLTRAN